MTSAYDEVISAFLGKVTDPDFVSYSEETIRELMQDWMHKACANKYTRSIFSYLKLNDEEETVSFELLYPDDDEDSDKDFVIDIIARGMVIEWLEPRVKSIVNINQMFSGKESKYYSQSAHLKEIKDLLQSEKTELRGIIRDYGYMHNSYIEGV